MEDKAFQWKMIFNPDPSKQKHKVFSVETHKKSHILSCFLTIQMLQNAKKF